MRGGQNGQGGTAWRSPEVRGRIFAVCFYYAGLITLSSLSGLSLPQAQVGVEIDKVVHFVLYGGLGFFLVRLPWQVGVGVGVGAVLSVLDELYQHFTPGRYADSWDAVADIAGILTVATGYRGWRWWRGKRHG